MVQIPTWVQQHACVQAPGGKAPGSNPPSSTALPGRRRGLVRTSTSVQIQVQIPAPALPTSPSINPSVEWGQHCSFLMGWLNHEVRNRVLLWLRAWHSGTKGTPYLLPALGGAAVIKCHEARGLSKAHHICTQRFLSFHLFHPHTGPLWFHQARLANLVVPISRSFT